MQQILLHVDKSSIEKCIDRLVFLNKLYVQQINEDDYIFRRGYYLAEENIANNIVTHTMQCISNLDYNKQIEKVSKKNDLVLSDEQKLAISTCLNSSISVITGGPGTGKTTIIKCIIDILENTKKDYVLCAPTGRAAKRIKETTGKEAKHCIGYLKLLKWMIMI